MFAHFWLRQCRTVLRLHLYCLPSRFTFVRYLYWFFGLCGIWSGVFCSVCADDSSAGSCVCLAQGCRCGAFFPNSAVFALVLGTSVLAYGILELPLLFLGYAYGVAFFDSVCLFSACLYPAVAGLVGFSCGPPSLVVPVCVCVGIFLRRRSCVFFLSSGSEWGRLLLRLFWCCFCASSCSANGFPRRVLPQVTLRGFRNLSGSSCLSCSCGGALLWGLWCLGAPLGFLPCAVLFLRGLLFAQVTLGGFSAFSVSGCLPYCCSGDVVWAATLPLYYLCFSCAGWLTGVCWVLHPVSGSSLWGCGCGPAWVPAFFWWGTLLPLPLLFSLGGSYCVVVQAP